MSSHNGSHNCAAPCNMTVTLLLQQLAGDGVPPWWGGGVGQGGVRVEEGLTKGAATPPTAR